MSFRRIEQSPRGCQRKLGSRWRNRPGILRIERDAERYPLAQTTPYGISMVQANDPAVAFNGVTNAVVCIIDSGLYTGHDKPKDLIRALKAEKRSQKSLRQALDSLKQLQAAA